MKYSSLFLSICFLFTSLYVGAQTDSTDARKRDILNFGIGLGFDYGGIGANLMAYPQRNIGIFVSGGFALAGFGYNAGIKLRFPSKKASVVTPALLAMYGYNTAILITNNAQYNKLFYGPSFGAGIDIRSKKPSSEGYLSIAILVPVRNPDVQNYIDMLKNNYGASFANSLLPVTFSVGYKFIMNK